MQTAFTLLFTLIFVLVVLTNLGFASRFALRHMYRDYREKTIGPLRWSRLIHENRGGSKTDRYDEDDFAALTTFSNTIRSGRLPLLYRGRGVASFAWFRDPVTGMIDLFVGVDEKHYGDGSSVRTLAAALGSKAEPLGKAPKFPSKGITVATRSMAQPQSAKSTVDKHGAVAAALSSTWESLEKGESAVVVFTIDMMQNSESKRWESNFAEEAIMRAGAAATYSSTTAAQAQLMAQNAVRVSIASANSTGNVDRSRSALNAATGSISSMGWRISIINLGTAHRRSATIQAIAGAVLAAGGAAITSSPFLGALSGLSVAAAVVLSVKPRMMVEEWVERRMSSGEIVVPEFIWASLRWRIQAIWRSNRRDAGGDQKVANRVAPPSCHQVLTFHPAAFYEAISFPRGGTRGDVSTSNTQDLGLPSDMLDVGEGIYIGEDGKGNGVIFPLSDIHYSLYAAGAPNSGKTNFLQVVFGGLVKCGMEKAGGLTISPIWGETKGEGAYDAWMIARHDPRAVFVDVHNPEAHWRLALEGPRISDGASVETVQSNITRLISSFQAAYGDGVKSASRDVFDPVMLISMLLSPDEIRHLELADRVNASKPNIIELSYFLLGVDSRIDPTARLLTMGSDMVPSDAREAALSDAIGRLSRYIGKDAKRNSGGDRVSSVANKLSDLRNAKRSWEPDAKRGDIYVGQLVQRKAPIVVNMGSFWDAERQSFNQDLDRAVSQRLIRSLNYLLWDYIKTNCNGWQKMGLRIPMFFDEVADVANDANSDDVSNTLEEGTKEGRSRGASYYLGGQSPYQMPPRTKTNVMGSRTKFWFNLHEGDDLRIAESDLNSGSVVSRDVTAHNIRSLPNGAAMGIMSRGQTVTPPFTLYVPLVGPWIEALFGSATQQDAIDHYRISMRKAAEEKREAEAITS